MGLDYRCGSARFLLWIGTCLRVVCSFLVLGYHHSFIHPLLLDETPVPCNVHCSCVYTLPRDDDAFFIHFVDVVDLATP